MSRDRTTLGLTLLQILLLSAVAFYSLGLAIVLSLHRMMVLDEFFAWNLLSDPSLRHALGSWQAGADSGGVLYYLLLWPLVRLGHGSVIVPRLFSAACSVLAATFWWRTLCRFLDAWSAALGVVLVWLSSGLLILYTAQVRFYAPLLFFAALAVWVTVHCAREEIPLPQAALGIFCAHLCLVLIHMLGILYSAMLLGALVLCLAPGKRAFALSGAGMLSWLSLPLCRTAIRNGSRNATSQAVPVFRDLLRFHLKSSAHVSILLVSAFGLFWALRDLLPRMRFSSQRRQLRFLAPVLCLAFLAGPLCIYVISHLGRPLGQVRYLLPYTLPLCTLCAIAVAQLRRLASVRRWGNEAVTLSCLGLTTALHVSLLRTLPAAPALDLRALPQAAFRTPVVVANEQTFFQLQYYKSNPDLQFVFLLPPAREPSRGIMATVAERGYFPHSFHSVDSFEISHTDYVFLTNHLTGKLPSLPRASGCQMQSEGTIAVDSFADPFLLISGCRSLQRSSF